MLPPIRMGSVYEVRPDRAGLRTTRFADLSVTSRYARRPSARPSATTLDGLGTLEQTAPSGTPLEAGYCCSTGSARSRVLHPGLWINPRLALSTSPRLALSTNHRLAPSTSPRLAPSTNPRLAPSTSHRLALWTCLRPVLSMRRHLDQSTTHRLVQSRNHLRAPLTRSGASLLASLPCRSPSYVLRS